MNSISAMKTVVGSLDVIFDFGPILQGQTGSAKH